MNEQLDIWDWIIIAGVIAPCIFTVWGLLIKLMMAIFKEWW